ncbi:MAG: hypothetical protein SPD11_09325 [Sphaerochaetaceae bacterium]|nr:hypothetical protein [Sphaerochaetaceae bacterium]
MDRTLLIEYGIDYDAGLSNSLGDPEFFKTLLSMFLQDDCFPRAKTAYAAKDYKTLFTCMHELKGVTGNAALTELYMAVVPLLELLREGAASDAEVDRLFSVVEAVYRRTCEGIVLAVAQ